MPSIIIPEAQNQNSIQEAVASEKPKGEPAILTASEIKRLFRDWEDLGRNDLSIDLDFATRARAYLEYQKNLEPVKRELAEAIYRPFVVTLDFKKPLSTLFNVIVEGKLNTKMLFYSPFVDGRGIRDLITLHSFKSLLLAANVPYASYIPSDTKTLVDFHSYAMANGWNVTMRKDIIEINLPKDAF